MRYLFVEHAHSTHLCLSSFPGQTSGSAKIPTIMLYDNDGRMRAAGAEATHPEMIDMAEDEGWTKVEW